MRTSTEDTLRGSATSGSRASSPSFEQFMAHGEHDTMSSTQPPTESGASPEKPEKKTAKGARGGAKGKSTKAAKAAQAPPATRADEIIEALKAASRDKEIDFERLVAALEDAVPARGRKNGQAGGRRSCRSRRPRPGRRPARTVGGARGVSGCARRSG